MLARGPAGPLERPDEIFRTSMQLQMLLEVDLRLLDIAIEEAAKLPSMLHVHVNLFPSTLLETIAQTFQSLFEQDPTGRQYFIEIVEQEQIEDHDRMWHKVQELRSIGLKLAIDDVGFGKSSLESILVLEPDVIKIDRRFVTDAWKDSKSGSNLRRLIAVAKSLNAELVAEGVDSPDDSDLLQSLGVSYGQGKLWGPLL